MKKDKSQRFVISLGGSLIAPKGGLDVKYLSRVRQLLMRRTKAGQRFVVVCGGGYVARQYQEAISRIRPSVTDRELDWVGIQATVINAHLMQAALGPLAHTAIFTDPRVKIRAKAPVIVGAGWKPGSSSDRSAVLMAESFGAQTVINLSNIDSVYDRDPNRYAGAKALSKMSWAEFRQAFGSKWVPGLNSPFDPVAATLAAKSGMRVIVAHGRQLNNLEKILSGQPFRGTTIL